MGLTQVNPGKCSLLLLCSLLVAVQSVPWIKQSQKFFQRPAIKECPPGYSLVHKPEGSQCLPDRSSQWRPLGNPKPVRRNFNFIIPEEKSTTTTTITETPWPPQGHSAFDWDRNRNHWEPHQRNSHGASRLEIADHHFSPRGGNEAFGSSHGTRLPQDQESLSRLEEECLQQDQVLWQKDNQCYPLLQQGPCSHSEWLVLKEKDNSMDEIEIVCETRPCPCHSKDPTLCEVRYDGPESRGCGNKCRVALAAEQDGICGHGEQLLLNPFGLAVCGCRGDPVHMRSALDQQCHPIGAQGPCPSNETLEFVPSLSRAICLPTLCPPDMVLHVESAQCFHLNTQGPCPLDSELVMDPKTKVPSCQLRPGQVRKRVFDLAPSHPLRESRNRELLLGKLRVQMSDCSISQNSIHCQDQDRTKKQEVQPIFVGLDEKMHLMQERRHERMARARKFLGWLRSFSKR